MIQIAHALEATWIFGSIFVIALIVSIRFKKAAAIQADEEGSGDKIFTPLSESTGTELKGFAILAVIFSHIGYFLVADHRFLFPFSILAGVGVDIFLFLSGFGMTMSMLKKGQSIAEFYKKRLPRLLVPLWIALAVFFVIDAVFLRLNYPWHYIVQSFLAFFPHADLFHDVDSPLWYFTLIMFYYLLYPIVFWFTSKKAWLTGLVLFVISFGILLCNFPFISGVANFYWLHMAAFPLGVLVASLFSNRGWQALFARLRSYGSESSHRALARTIYWVAIVICAYVAGYFAYYSGVGKSTFIAESISILTGALIVILFAMKKAEFGLLTLVGIYSYEIYLLHWPIMERYSHLYAEIPAWFATLIYLALFIALGWLLQKASKKIIAFMQPFLFPLS